MDTIHSSLMTDFYQQQLKVLSEEIQKNGRYPQLYLPRHNPPSKNVIITYLYALDKWKSKYKKEDQKLHDALFRVVAPHLPVLPNFKGQSFPSPDNGCKVVRHMTHPFHIPDIGGKNGILTHLLRSIPIGSGTCFNNAFLCSLAIPGVKYVFGWYPTGAVFGGIRKSLKGLDEEIGRAHV